MSWHVSSLAVSIGGGMEEWEECDLAALFLILTEFLFL